MSDKKLTIRNTPREILEAIEREHGIQIIKDFINKKTIEPEKRKGRPKSGVFTGASVYFNMYGLDINNRESYKNFIDAQQEKTITEAKKEIAEKNEIEENTADKHVTTFNKKATELNYDKFYKGFVEHMNNYDANNYDDDINNLENLKEFLKYYSVERQTHNQMTRMIEVIGDNRYFGIDIQLAIAMYLKFKYDLSKNHSNIHATHKENEYMDIPF